MKIIHVVLNYHPSVGGTQWLFKNISEGLVAQYNDDVTVLTVDSLFGPEKKLFQKITPSKEVINGVTVIRFSFVRWHLPLLRLIQKIWVKLFKKSNTTIEDLQYTIFSNGLNKTLANIKANVICGSSSAYSFTKYPLWRRHTASPKPFVSMGAIHFSNENNHAITPITLQALQQADKYIANTEFEKDNLAQLGIAEKNIDVIGCGVHTEIFEKANGSHIRHQLGLIENDVLFTFIGRQEPQKNIDVLLQAFGKLQQQHSHVHLLIAGAETTYSATLQKQIIQLSKQQKNIHTINNFTEAEKANMYAASNVFVSASANESFGIVFVEAWACKKPVIAANIGAIASLVTHNYNGILVEPFSSNSLYNAMQQLLIDAALQQQLGNNGYNTVIEKYTWPVIVSKYRNTYSNAIKNYQACVA
jgi:glycosyltransferase involved in cell wall biosynthesis